MSNWEGRKLGVCLKTDSENDSDKILTEYIGIPLFKALFSGQILGDYENALYDASDLTILLNIKAPGLLNIPWEYMYNDHLINDFLLVTAKKRRD